MSNLVPVYFDKAAYDCAVQAYEARTQARQGAYTNGWGTTCDMIYPPKKTDYLVFGSDGAGTPEYTSPGPFLYGPQ